MTVKIKILFSCALLFSFSLFVIDYSIKSRQLYCFCFKKGQVWFCYAQSSGEVSTTRIYQLLYFCQMLFPIQCMMFGLSASQDLNSIANKILVFKQRGIARGFTIPAKTRLMQCLEAHLTSFLENYKYNEFKYFNLYNICFEIRLCEVIRKVILIAT